MLALENTMRIRDAVQSDLDAITRVQARTMVASEYYDNSLDEELEYHHLHPRVVGYFGGTHNPSYSLPERTVLVAEHEGQIIGFVAGHRSTRMGCSAELQWMFVLPQWQRKGIGASLLRHVRQWFKVHGSTKVIVDAPPQNPYRAFYLNHGAALFDEYWLYWENIGEMSGI